MIIGGGNGWGAGAERRQFSERSASAVNVFEHSEKKSPSDNVASSRIERSETAELARRQSLRGRKRNRKFFGYFVSSFSLQNKNFLL